MTLAELVAGALPEVSPAKLPAAEARGVECDSRAVQKDFLFVAVRGVKADGSEFVSDAVSRGASAVVVDKPLSSDPGVPVVLVPDARAAASLLAARFHGDPARAMKMVGVTGTNGKTTCTYLLEHIFSAAGSKAGVIGTISHRFAGQEIAAAETTPGPVKAQALLARMRDAGCRYVSMEVSSHALDQKRTAGIDFAAALFTNLTQDHLDYHKTMEAYFEAKSKLFTGLSKDAAAAINADDAWGAKLAEMTKARVLTYGIKKFADLKADGISFEEDSTHFILSYQGKLIPVRVPLFGLHNVYNALGALAVAAGLGLSVEGAARALETFPGVPGRLEAVGRGQGFKVFVDFAHTPDGLLNVLKTLQDYRRQRLFVVFGCGGDRDRTKRPQMARIASQFSDHVYVTSDNPRTENPSAIAQEVCAGFPEGFKGYTVVLDRRKAIRLALLSARDGDVVLLAGKGHERSQIIGTESLPFSDREEAERVLDGR